MSRDDEPPVGPSILSTATPSEAFSRLSGSIEMQSACSGLLVLQSDSETPSRSSMAATRAASAGSSDGEADNEAPLVIRAPGAEEVLDGCSLSPPPPQPIVAAPAKARARTIFPTVVSSNDGRPPVHPLLEPTQAFAPTTPQIPTRDYVIQHTDMVVAQDDEWVAPPQSLR